MFKTAKYRPAMPARFVSLEHAREVFRGIFDWYNNRHHHSGIVYLTPTMAHNGGAEAALDARHRSRMAAYLAHPQRFVNGPPRRESLPSAVWINPPEKTTHQDGSGTTIGDPADPEVIPACSTYGQLAQVEIRPSELAAVSKASH